MTTMTTAQSQTRRQATLFPAGTCQCEHVIPVMEYEEPCPDCMEDPYDPHDCPLVLTPTKKQIGEAKDKLDTTHSSVEELLGQIEDDLDLKPAAV